jgi:hypothetical protein
MTKPADSERTAKAREQELKAREFREHGLWPTVMPADYSPAWESRWEDRFAAAYVESERATAIKEAAKAMCNCCRDIDVWNAPVRESTGRWTHWAKPGTGYVSYRCEAEPLQELIRGER